MLRRPRHVPFSILLLFIILNVGQTNAQALAEDHYPLWVHNTEDANTVRCHSIWGPTNYILRQYGAQCLKDFEGEYLRNSRVSIYA